MSESNTWDYIAQRAVKEAEYIIRTGATVRACANNFKTSKSGVHKDVTERLRSIDVKLYEGVRAVLNKNLSERHIRGGIATRNKYLGRPHMAGCACKGVCRCRKGGAVSHNAVT